MAMHWARKHLAAGSPLDEIVRRGASAAEQGVRMLGERLARRPWMAERLRFFHAWRASPREIGAIAPSSARLARAMTRHIRIDSGPVIELGAGTGVFTRALLARGVAPADLALVEMDARFAAQLKRDHPQADVLAVDARRLARHRLFDGRPAGAVVCGLPLLNLPLRVRIAIVRAAFAHLKGGGAFYFFTYGAHCPLPRRIRDRLGLRAAKIDFVLANVPPAHVWKMTRRGTLNCPR